MELRYNLLSINSLLTFANVKGRVSQTCKDVYFVRCVGHDNDYLNEIEKIDKLLYERENCGQCKYNRLSDLPRLENPEDISYYIDVYKKWEKSGRNNITLQSIAIDMETEKILIEALNKLCKKFHQSSKNTSESIEKNFVVKMLFWLDVTAQSFMVNWNERESYKYIYNGSIKKQEYLFLYFLTLLGIDVMILMPTGEIDLEKSLLDLSYKLQLDVCSNINVPIYNKSNYRKSTQISNQAILPEKVTSTAKSDNIIKEVDMSTADHGSKKCEKGFEELAMLASSVVMIIVHDTQGNITATGSGIVISAGGYILTNNHVASGGGFYSVKIENDEEIYKTDELIKNNSFLDLALIRIDNRKLRPIPIYRDTKKLVRGQKVVAIGSPLGMFNSVSDGIISGFRNINDVEMIQFTAPISHGSSGGALLNLYGEVIGISTAGVDSGQNINLAVDYRDINNFVHGFI
jgi:S1-C subfamily serine protease